MTEIIFPIMEINVVFPLMTNGYVIPPNLLHNFSNVDLIVPNVLFIP